jgi:hypothetical protein
LLQRRSWNVLLLLAVGSAEPVLAQGVGTISVSGDPPALAVTSAGAGTDLLPGVNSSTTYSITVLQSGLGITGQLDAPMPPNTRLSVTLASPGGAVSLGPVDLTAAPQTLVRSLPLGTFSAMPITYEFHAGVSAGVVPPTTRTVTLTITAVP